MDLKWASPKVRQLIDKHLLSLGIDTKVPEVSILSKAFKSNVNTLNKISQASDMEHAIRWHIKVNLDQDPALYNHFKNRLELILASYKEKWETIVAELGKLTDEMTEGRKQEIEGISVVEAPFFELLRLSLPIDADLEKTKDLLHTLLKETAAIKNFWTGKPTERKRMEGLLEDEIHYSGIDGMSTKAAELTTELMKPAKTREADLR